MDSPPPLLRARLVDGPFAGTVRLLEPQPDGTAPRMLTLPVTDPGLGVPEIAYEHFDSPAADGDPRYRVAPVAIPRTR